MKDQHEEFEELLAGYALQSLEGFDQEAAERLMVEHLPTCARCRQTLSDFQTVVGELSLAASPGEPPDLLLPRIRKQLAGAPARRAPISRWITTAVAVALAGLTSWNAILNLQLGHVRHSFSSVSDAMAFLAQPDSTEIGMGGPRAAPDSHVVVSYRPVEQHVYLVGTHVPAPRPGSVYVLWLGRDGSFSHAREFVPEEGIVVLYLPYNLLRYDEILVTEEPRSEVGPSPSGIARWQASLATL